MCAKKNHKLKVRKVWIVWDGGDLVAILRRKPDFDPDYGYKKGYCIFVNGRVLTAYDKPLLFDRRKDAKLYRKEMLRYDITET